MQNSIAKKSLVIGIIFLFIGISIAPSVTSIHISKDKNSNDNLVEINVQLCRTDGVEDHKMFVTQEQDEQFDILIESFKADLDNAETREEKTFLLISSMNLPTISKSTVRPCMVNSTSSNEAVSARFQIQIQVVSCRTCLIVAS